MPEALREFQVFVKPVGSRCNLACDYCYYLNKDKILTQGQTFRMSDTLLEEYIVQHISASPEPDIRFSWHGGEPTVLGLDTFRKIVEFQKKHLPKHRKIVNGIQTNGTLLDNDWCRFLAEENFTLGLSMDGPQELHDTFRKTKDQKPTFTQTMRGYELVRNYGINCDILCVVNAVNVECPEKVYRFFKRIQAPYVSFLPLVEHQPNAEKGVSSRSVPSQAWGGFLCSVFDEWKHRDIGRLKIQIFEEAARSAFGQEHSLCIFRPVCGDIPVIEHNGDFYSCDHFVDPEHLVGNIIKTPLRELLESPAQRAFGQAKLKDLPLYCQRCEVRMQCHGECPKNRFIQTPDGEPGLNYLCAGYKRFFNHCQSWVDAVASQWKQPSRDLHESRVQEDADRIPSKTGRNDPCPCGSGSKYKKCCSRH